MTTLDARHRSEHRLFVYENAVRAVGLDRSRRSSTAPPTAPSNAPYSPPLDQVVAEADRQVARENRELDRRQPRSEAPPMTPARPAVRPPLDRVPQPKYHRPATASTGPGTWSLPGPRPTSRRPAPETSPPPHTFDTRRLADTLARALPPPSNRTLSSLLRRLDGDHAIDDAAARAALRVLHGRPRRPGAGPPPSAVITTRCSGPRIAQQQGGGVPLTEAEQRRIFARVVLAALPAARRADPHLVPAGR